METTRDADDVRAVINNWARAVRNRDRSQILANHVEDVVMFDVPEPLQARGIDEYNKTWDAFFKYNSGGDGSFDLIDLKIVTGDRVAFAYALLRIDGPGTEPICRLTVCLEKIKDNRLITHEHHSSPHKST